jgi:hypothetical protein
MDKNLYIILVRREEDPFIQLRNTTKIIFTEYSNKSIDNKKFNG